jgi:RimJ/RimL family protein N-acetyltransferase
MVVGRTIITNIFYCRLKFVRPLAFLFVILFVLNGSNVQAQNGNEKANVNCERQLIIPSDLKLEGQRVVLRPAMPADYPALQEILSDRKTMEFLNFMIPSSSGWTLDQIKERYDKKAAVQSAQSGASFVAEDVKTGKVLGGCGLNKVDLTHKTGDFGLIIHFPYWGTGVAQECHLLTLTYAFEVLHMHRIEFHTLETNMRMRKFYENIGAALETMTKEAYFESGKYVNGFVFTLFENDWPKTKQLLQDKLKNAVN